MQGFGSLQVLGSMALGSRIPRFREDRTQELGRNSAFAALTSQGSRRSFHLAAPLVREQVLFFF